MSTRRGVRRPVVRFALVAIVAIAMAAMVVTIVLASRGVSSTTVGLQDLRINGIATSHREIMLMLAASESEDAGALGEINLRRQLLQRQLDVTMPELLRRREQNPHVVAFIDALAAFDREAMSGRSPAESPSLRASVVRLEVTVKRLYDYEGLRYLNLTVEVMDERERTQKYLVALAVMILLSGIAALTVLYRTFRHNLREKAAELSTALRSLEASQADRSRLLDEAIDASERERTWLAAELHDGPVQSLSALCYSLDRLEIAVVRGQAEPAKDDIAGVRRALADEVTALRRLMSQLRPPVLDQGGIEAALRDYVDAFARRTGVACTTAIDVDPDADVSMQAETMLYRVAQESLTNVSRHARATKVTLALRHADPGTLELVVEDDGVGFETGSSGDFVRGGHFGLAGMGERALMAGGSLQVSSEPGAGTRVVARVPLVPTPRTAALAGV